MRLRAICANTDSIIDRGLTVAICTGRMTERHRMVQTLARTICTDANGLKVKVDDMKRTIKLLREQLRREKAKRVQQARRGFKPKGVENDKNSNLRANGRQVARVTHVK